MITVIDSIDERALELLQILVEEHCKLDGAYKIIGKKIMSEIEQNVEFLGNKILEGDLTSESILDTYITWLRLEDRAGQWLNPLSYPAIYVREG